VQYAVLGQALVSGGVVYDAASTPETGGRPNQGTLSSWGWRAGATTAAFGDAIRVHTSVSQRARFPALRELYSGALDRFEPNPSLRPERLLGAELGATVLGGAATSAGVALQAVTFHHRLDDAVVRVTGADRRFRRVNRDEVRSTGVELLAGWAPPATRALPGSWLAGVAVTADVVAQRVRVYDRTRAGADPETAAARRPEHQPELRGSADLEMPLPLGVRARTGARYTGRQFCVHPDLGAQVELGAQTVGDAVLTRRWARAGRRGLLRQLRAALALDNVTDATVYDQCGLPQPGRTLRLSFELG
jgi:iron complex outermembrane receptor protein